MLHVRRFTFRWFNIAGSGLPGLWIVTVCVLRALSVLGKTKAGARSVKKIRGYDQAWASQSCEDCGSNPSRVSSGVCRNV